MKQRVVRIVPLNWLLALGVGLVSLIRPSLLNPYPTADSDEVARLIPR